jgi:hypothetical protein
MNPAGWWTGAVAGLLAAATMASCGWTPRSHTAVLAGRSGATPHDVRASHLERVQLGLQADRLRTERAQPGRAILLVSPFGPAPATPPAPPRAAVHIDSQLAVEMTRHAEGRSVWTDVGCCRDSEIEIAEGLVLGEMAARDLPRDTPVFVVGTDEDLLERLCEQLGDAGLTRLFAVVKQVQSHGGRQ